MINSVTNFSYIKLDEIQSSNWNGKIATILNRQTCSSIDLGNVCNLAFGDKYSHFSVC